MAWQTRATSNEDMVSQLQVLGVIQSDIVASAFRAVDRRDFLPAALSCEAYFDQPLRHEILHQSAVHIYAMCLEALDFENGNTFLNIGSGSGYFSTLAASLCGQHAVHHGLELNEDLVKISKLNHNKSISKNGDKKFATVKFFFGDAFGLEVGSCMRYDRIYIGAACPTERVKEFLQLLPIGGILVAPVKDCLVKVTRVNNSNPFVEEQLSIVRFAPLCCSESYNTFSLPKENWNAMAHHIFPSHYKDSVMALLMSCNTSKKNEKVPFTMFLGKLVPLGLLPEILAFTDRDWFLPESFSNACDTSKLKFGVTLGINRFTLFRLIATNREEINL